MEKKGSWILVADFEEVLGWTHSMLLDDNKKMVIIISGKDISLREGANSESKIVAFLGPGILLEPLNTKYNWAKVKVMQDSTTIGWIEKKYLWPQH